jgi:N-acetylglucosamine-6-sulfatase
MLSLLAKRGITFTNSFIDLPLCAPSRASFLTGQAAHNVGVRANSPKDQGGWDAFRSKESNALPVWLKNVGYRTALIGKYLNHYGQQSAFEAWIAYLASYLNINVGSATPRDWGPPGWDLRYAFTGSGRVRYYDYSINENGKILNFGNEPSDYSTDVLKERAIRFIQDQKDAGPPFFLLLSVKAVHPQAKRPIPAPKYAEALREARMPEGPAFNENDKQKQELQLGYKVTIQTLQSVDDLVEAIVGALDSTGELENTVIIYTSDNGNIFGDHRMIGKTSAYEGAIRVPLILRGPGIPENERREQLVNNLDVVATIVELAGATPGVMLDGRSLSPLKDGSAPGEARSWLRVR